MEPQNQMRFQEYQQTVNHLTQLKANLESDIKTVEEQLRNMKLELDNVEVHITYNKIGMAALKLYTENNIALVAWDNPEQPLTLNQHQAPPPQTQQVTQTAHQVHQPTAPGPPITQQAQATFAPKQVPDFPAGNVQQGPQIMQGQPPSE